jgi:hypothetical protein
MNEIQILYDTHQHHVLSTQSGLRYLKIVKKGYEGERDKVMVLRELKLLAAALYVGRQGVIPPGLFSSPAVAQLEGASALQLPPNYAADPSIQPSVASLRTGVATQCPSYMWEKAIAACNCRPAPIFLSQRSPI